MNQKTIERVPTCGENDVDLRVAPAARRAADRPASAPSVETVSLDDLCALLPGPYYMDPPDGGNTPVMEQLRRMAEDAAKYRASAPSVDRDSADSLNGGMHASIFVKVWGDAGGGDAGRIALANYAFELGKKAASTAPQPVDAAQAVPVIPHSLAETAAARKQHERINAMQQGVVGVLAAIKQEAEAVKRGAIIGSPSAPADAAFHDFWYSHMQNEQMQPPLNAISYSTAKFIWDSAAPSPAAQPAAQGAVTDEREALIACLGDDAAKLADANPDDEMAQTMEEAAAMLQADAAPAQPTDTTKGE